MTTARITTATTRTECSANESCPVSFCFRRVPLRRSLNRPFAFVHFSFPWRTFGKQEKKWKRKWTWSEARASSWPARHPRWKVPPANGRRRWARPTASPIKTTPPQVQRRQLHRTAASSGWTPKNPQKMNKVTRLAAKKNKQTRQQSVDRPDWTELKKKLMETFLFQVRRAELPVGGAGGDWNDGGRRAQEEVGFDTHRPQRRQPLGQRWVDRNSHVLVSKIWKIFLKIKPSEKHERYANQNLVRPLCSILKNPKKCWDCEKKPSFSPHSGRNKNLKKSAS